MALEAALFDFNGTMIFDSDLQVRSWKKFLGDRIGRDVTDDEFMTHVHGKNAEHSLRHFLGELDAVEVARLEEEKEVISRQMYLDDPANFHLAAGLPELLDALEARGVALNIGTAAAMGNVRFYFDHLGLDRWFDISRVAFNDRSFPGKPAPDIYLHAAANVGAKMSGCVVFEDAVAGLEAARRSGAARIVGLTSSIGADELMAIPGVTRAIDDYADLEDLLDMFA